MSTESSTLRDSLQFRSVRRTLESNWKNELSWVNSNKFTLIKAIVLINKSKERLRMADARVVNETNYLFQQALIIIRSNTVIL